MPGINYDGNGRSLRVKHQQHKYLLGHSFLCGRCEGIEQNIQIFNITCIYIILFYLFYLFKIIILCDDHSQPQAPSISFNVRNKS